MIDERLRYFKLLGINPTDNHDAIKKAYRKMAFRYHPDKNKSADAHQKFILLNEAYDILIGNKKIATEPKTKQKSEEEIHAEKVAFAKAQYKRHQEEEERKDALYFAAITSGWKWKWFKIGAYYSAVISLMLIIDYFATGVRETLDPFKITYAYHNQTISTKGEHFTVREHDYWNSDYYGQIRGNRSFLFKDLKSISMILDPPEISTTSHSDKMILLDGFEEYEMYTTYSFNSMYGVFPVIHFFLFVPLLLVIYKRPVLRFSIWRLVSIYMLFPLSVFLTFSNDRIFHFLGIF